MAAYDITTLGSSALTATNSSETIAIDSTHLFTAYNGADNDGYLRTYSLDGSYNFTNIDELEQDIANGLGNTTQKIDSTHFIVAYTGVGSDGFIKTFSIDGSYDNITEIDSLEHDITRASVNRLVTIDSTHYLLLYFDTSLDLRVKIFEVDGSYIITELDSEIVDANPADAVPVGVCLIDSTHALVTYRDAASKGDAVVVSWDGSYNITVGTPFEFESTNCHYPSVVKIDTEEFAVFYAGIADDGFYRVLNVDSSTYAITATTAATEHQDAITCRFNGTQLVDSTHLILSYQNSAATDAFAKVFEWDGSYVMTQVGSTFTISTSGGSVSTLRTLTDYKFIFEDSNTIYILGVESPPPSDTFTPKVMMIN